jgi:uncharacterized membrane protein YphA (DoxX/SURF4 family)
MVKVPCDPAQIPGSHAVFRVRFPAAQQTRAPRFVPYSPPAPTAWEVPPRAAERTPSGSGTAGTVAVVPAAGTVHQTAGRAQGALVRRAPVVWTGRSVPGATELLPAVRDALPTLAPHGADATEVLPRLPGTTDAPTTYPAVGAPRGPVDAPPVPGNPQRHPSAPAPDDGRPERYEYHEYYAYQGDQSDEPYAHEPREGRAERYGNGRPGSERYGDEPNGAEKHESDRYGDGHGHGSYDDEEEYERSAARSHSPAAGAAARRGARETVRHAYYPGRRMNLGLVLLPLRIFLGSLSCYAGMSKLCDAAYFDGDAQGSLVRTLRALHPWAFAEPLQDAALQHPVGAGLTFAFLQVIVGVLTVMGLWQRVAAGCGALLAAVLVLTVSWGDVPGYDAPDIIYLAAWSPLIIAGAPVYSVDGRLSSEAWRILGPRAELGELRRRVLRRGALLGGLVIGLTFLIGALLGGAVRDADRIGGGHGRTPHNELPGSPLPGEPGARHSGGSPLASQSPAGEAPARPSQSATAGATQGTATAGAQQPGASRGTGIGRATLPQSPATSAGPTSSGGSGTSSATGGGTGSGGGESGDLVGGLLG